MPGQDREVGDAGAGINAILKRSGAGCVRCLHRRNLQVLYLRGLGVPQLAMFRSTHCQMPNIRYVRA